MKEGDETLKDCHDESTEPPPAANLNRGYGEVSVIINPLLHFTLMDKHSSQTIRTLTAKIVSKTMTTIYISPKATTHEKKRCWKEYTSSRDGVPY